MPEGLAPLYEEATIAVHRRLWRKGEKRWREFLAQAPTFHPAYHNLAIALIQQGRDAEAEIHLRKAMEIDPSYVFAPCTLAVIYLQKNRTAEARELLDKVVIPDKIHPSAMATYCSAQAQVTAAEGDLEKAAGWLDIGAKVDPDNQVVIELRKRLKLPRLPEKALAEKEAGQEKHGWGF
jgi:Tfp pilus assembly protein PilF